jgi:hypothetical protein
MGVAGPAPGAGGCWALSLTDVRAAGRVCWPPAGHADSGPWQLGHRIVGSGGVSTDGTGGLGSSTRSVVSCSREQRESTIAVPGVIGAGSNPGDELMQTWERATDVSDGPPSRAPMVMRLTIRRAANRIMASSCGNCWRESFPPPHR